jgi:hypothetical protein
MTYMAVEVRLHALLTSVRDWGERSGWRPGRFFPPVSIGCDAGEPQKQSEPYKLGKRKRNPIYVYRSFEARSRKHCCSWKAINVTYFCVCACMRVAVAQVCAFADVVLLIQHAKRMRHIVCGLCGSTIPFRHCLPNAMIFGEKNTEHETCVLVFPTHLIWSTSHSKKNSTRYCHKFENVFM